MPTISPCPCGHARPQVPEGALPLLGQPVTHASQITLPPYSCHVATLHFYFPRPGAFRQATPSVTRGGRPAWLPAAPPPPLEVLPAPPAAAPGAAAGGGAAPFDWLSFVRRAPDAELLRYLREGDLSVAEPLSALSPRCAGAAFFGAAAAALAARGAFDPEVWKWAVRHGDEAALRQLLPTTDLVRGLGVPLATRLAESGAAAGDTGHLDWREFWPWVNAYCRPIPEEGERASGGLRDLSLWGFRGLLAWLEPAWHKATCRNAHK